jgi:hypothetical protein
MTKLFLLPGGLICDAVGLTEDSKSRQILRMFLNTLNCGEWSSYWRFAVLPS